MKYTLETLSPLHIGTGEDTEYTDQLQVDNCIYPVSKRQFMEFLDLYPDLVKPFSKYLDDRDLELKDLLEVEGIEVGKELGVDNLALADLRTRYSLHAFAESVNLGEAFQSFVLNHPQSRAIRMQGNIANVRNLRLTITNGAMEPIIPGSTIKGAIRTALLFHFLCTEGLPQRKYGRWNAKQLDDWIEHEAFFCWSAYKKGRGKNKHRNDALMDLMKFIHVTDAVPNEDKAETCVYATARIALAWKDPDLKKDLETECQFSSSHIEAIPPGKKYGFEIRFLSREFMSLVNTFRNKRRFAEEHWQGLPNKIKWVFGIEWEELRFLTEKVVEERVLSHIQSVLKPFLSQVAKKDQTWHQDALHLAANQRQVLNLLETNTVSFTPKLEATPIRLGFGKGFHSATELLFFLDNKDKKKFYKKIIDSFVPNQMEKGIRAFHQMDRFPYSRAVAFENHDFHPMGWASIQPATP